jgi:ABC-type polysaccharide/polyol phosphate transport system ATPase subunit
MNTIEVEGLSKKYLLGEDRPGGHLREAISRTVRRMVRLGLRPRRDEIWALRDIDLRVAEGEALGVVGPNGAGKSTLLKILSRITEPTAGVARTRGRVTSLLEVGTGFHPELTGRENVYLNGAILGMRRRDIDRRFDEIVTFAALERFIDTPVKRYSSGMYLRLAFAVAAHLEPDIMVVDEVLAVGDAEFQAKCLGRMESAERGNRTIVFVSHNLEAISRLCTRAIYLEGGVIRSEGRTSDVVDVYLQAQAALAAEEAGLGRGDGGAALRTVAVLDASGRARDVLRRDQPFAIEVRFWVGTAVPGLDVSVQIVDGRGVEVLNEAWSDREPERPTGPGEYIARLQIPAMLNVGAYAVGVWIGSRYETLLHETAMRRFRLEGDARGRPRRTVVANVPWEVRSLSRPEDRTA